MFYIKKEKSVTPSQGVNKNFEIFFTIFTVGLLGMLNDKYNFSYLELSFVFIGMVLLFFFYSLYKEGDFKAVIFNTLGCVLVISLIGGILFGLVKLVKYFWYL